MKTNLNEVTNPNPSPITPKSKIVVLNLTAKYHDLSIADQAELSRFEKFLKAVRYYELADMMRHENASVKAYREVYGDDDAQ